MYGNKSNRSRRRLGRLGLTRRESGGSPDHLGIGGVAGAHASIDEM